jgi:hypothetical protein
MKKYIQNSLKLTLFFLMEFAIAFASATENIKRLDTKILQTRARRPGKIESTRKTRDSSNELAAQREIKEEPETVAPIQETEASRPVKKLPPGARPMPGMGGGMGFGNIIGGSTMFQKKAAQQNNALVNDSAAAENRLKQMEEERERSKKEVQRTEEEAIKKRLEEEKKEIDRKEEELETQKRQQEKEIQLQKERVAAQKKEQDRLKRLEEEKKKQEEELEKKRIEIEKEAERLQIEKEKIEQKKREEAELLQIQKERLAREEEERERLKLEEEERQRQEDRIKQELIEQELRQKEAEKLQKEKREREREEEAERKREEKRKRKELKRQQKEERERLEREEKERQEEFEKLLVHKEEYDGEERLKAFDAKLAAGNSWMRTVRRRNEAEQERQLQIDHFISDIENTNPFQRARQRELEIAKYKKETAEMLKRKKEEQQTELENQLVHKKEYDEEGHEHEEQQKLREHLKEQERLRKENEKKEKDRFEEEIRLRREKEEEESKEKVRQENFDEKLTKGNNLLRALRRRNENEQEAEQKKRNFESNIINSKPFQSAFIRNLNEQRISNEEFEKEIARKEAARVQRENAQIRTHEKDEQKATSPGSSFIVPQETRRERTPGATLQEHYKNYEAHKNLINIRKEHAQKREQRREAEAAELRHEQEETFLQKMWQQNDQAARAREEAWKQEALQQMANEETEEKNKAIESVPEEHTNVSEKINEIMAHKNDLAFLLQFKHEKEGHAQNVLAFLADQEHKAEKEFFIICATLLRYHEVAAFEMLKEIDYDPSLKQIGFFMDNFMGNKEFRSEKEIRAIGILENEDEDTKKALFLIQQLTLINKKGETFISHFSRARTQFNGHNAYSYFTKNAQILFDNFFGPEAANDMIEFYKNMRPGNYKKIIINENGKYESHDAEYWNETKSYAREQKRLTSGRLLDQKARSR